MTTTPDDVDQLSFEDALERLESIIDRVESGEIGLEDSLKQYESGAALIKRCRSVLDRTEKRIAELSVDAQGRLKAEGEDETDS